MYLKINNKFVKDRQGKAISEDITKISSLFVIFMKIKVLCRLNHCLYFHFTIKSEIENYNGILLVMQ